jgi:hypothetical protein
MNIDDGASIRKVDGRSKEARAMKAAQHFPPSTSGEVLGRDGEILSRKRTGTADPFFVPPELIEKGWEMQWIAHSVTGNTEMVMDQNLQMLENGWRPVHADRPGFAGRYMPAGNKGHIVRGGQGLYERPKQLCEEARAEEVRLAKQLISDRNESLKLSGVNKNLPQGFEMNQRYRGTGGNIKMSIDPALDIQASQKYDLAEPGE